MHAATIRNKTQRATSSISDPERNEEVWIDQILLQHAGTSVHSQVEHGIQIWASYLEPERPFRAARNGHGVRLGHALPKISRV